MILKQPLSKLLAIGLFCNSMAAFYCSADIQKAQPFERVQIFTGGAFSVPGFIGAYDGEVDAGYTPDVIIGSCGGAWAVAIIKAFPDRQERTRFIKSAQFQELLRAPETDASLLSAVSELAHSWSLEYRTPRVDANLFSNQLFEVPMSTSVAALNSSFSATGPRAIIIGSKTSISSKDIGESLAGRKVFQEILYTDPDTAQHLSGFVSPVSVGASSTVEPSTLTITDHSLSAAARVSVTDPYLINPVSEGGSTFFGGAIDLYPVELAKALGSEVSMDVESKMPPFAEGSIWSIFGFGMNERRAIALDEQVDHWMDFTNMDPQGSKKDVGFTSPKIGLHLSNGVPANETEFAQSVTDQYKVGYFRAQESLQLPIGDLTHIRELKK
jgi:hypothetical protein